MADYGIRVMKREPTAPKDKVVEEEPTIKPKDLYVHKNVAALNNRVCCKYHPEAHLIDDEGTASMICSECGLVVVEQMISEEAEWRNFSDDTRDEGWGRSRVGAAENRFLSAATNLQTFISSVDRMSEYGQTIVRHQKRRNGDRAIIIASRLIEEMCDRINLPASVCERAQNLYYRVFQNRRLKGNVIECDAKTAACLFIACDQENCPRTLKEISGASESSARLINRTQRQIRKELNLSNNAISSVAFLPRFCGRLELSREVTKRASRIVEKAKLIPGAQRAFPETLAAASIYIASTQKSGIRHTQKDIGNSVGLSGATISRASRLIADQMSDSDGD